jgi:menaquinone-9 beta-reductase
MAADYDIGIVGGGLGALTLAIQAAQQGYRVVLFEKEQYPFHKVCGEYISNESWNFLERCGMPLDEWQLPKINKLTISASSGKLFNFQLPLGGFGISRYKLDNSLYEKAVSLGVVVYTATKVNDVKAIDDVFHISSDTTSVSALVVVGAFGKKANLDVKWGRDFIQHKPTKINNYLGVKYHIEYPHPVDNISLHNFTNGYCGISAIENNKCCLCYLTTAENLVAAGNSITAMEQNILSKNKQLAAIFSNARFLHEQPITISQINFHKKEQVNNHILLVGDAAGMITPLCGNGMSMAMQAGCMALAQIQLYLNKRISRQEMELNYQKNWQKQFAFRTATGRLVQQFFGGASTAVFLQIMSKSAYLSKKLIQQTHGQPF